MRCPICQFEQPEAPDCIACGTEIQPPPKPVAASKPVNSAPGGFNTGDSGSPALPPEEHGTTPSPTPGVNNLPRGNPPASSTESDLRIQSPSQEEDPVVPAISPALRWVRGLGGLLGTLLGGWLFVFGQDFVLAPLEMVVVLLFGCISLFWILSAWIRISVRQFRVESTLFVVSALALRLWIPDAFDVNRLSRDEGTTSRPLIRGSSDSGCPFERGTWELVRQARIMVDNPGDPEKLEKWKRANDRLQGTYTQLPQDTQERWTRAYKRLTFLLNRLETMEESRDPWHIREAVEALEELITLLETIPPHPGDDPTTAH